mmetsp:Transcript_16832/g.43133  ORF Transcript_16832/g.43133 Transcript_16832/m.43133 type:complete len:283 (-) Transcript_16832:109-957(-)
MPSTTVPRTSLLAKRPAMEKSVDCVRMYELMRASLLESVPAQPTLKLVEHTELQIASVAASSRALQKMQLRSRTAQLCCSRQVSSGTKLTSAGIPASTDAKSSWQVPQPRLSHEATTFSPRCALSTRLRLVTMPALPVSCVLLLTIRRGALTKSPLYATTLSTPASLASASPSSGPLSARSSASPSTSSEYAATLRAPPSAARSPGSQGCRTTGSPLASTPLNHASGSPPGRYARPSTYACPTVATCPVWQGSKSRLRSCPAAPASSATAASSACQRAITGG